MAARARVPREVRFYLKAQFAATLGMELCYALAGLSEGTYSLVYACGDVVILTGNWNVMLSATKAIRKGIIREALLIGTMLAAIVALGYEGAWTANTWTVFIEGFVLVVTGVGLAQVIPFISESTMLRSLVILWLLLATFDFAFILFKSYPWMTSLNDWLPSWLCITAFSWIALRDWISGKVAKEVQHGGI